MSGTASLTALRRLAVTTQEYAARPRRARAEEVEAAIRRASCIQLDTISTVERCHRVAIASRAGVDPPGVVPKLLRDGIRTDRSAPPSSLAGCAPSS